MSNGSKSRNPYFDNAKFMLMIPVILAHVLEPLRKTDSIYMGSFFFLAVFTVPMFALVSGFFAKVVVTENSARNEIDRILIPLLVFQVLYELPYSLLQGHYIGKPLQPFWILFYFLSLFCWRVMLPYFSRLKHPILISIFISIVAGYASDIGMTLSLSRTIFFFPFFLIGYYLKTDHIDILTSFKARIITYPIFIIGFFLAIKFYTIDFRWFFGSSSYMELGVDTWYAGFYRCLTYITGFILGISFLSIIPVKQRFITNLGKNSLQVYLLHGFILLTCRAVGVYKYLENINFLLLWPSLILFTLLLNVLLSSEFAARATSFLFSPRIGELFLKPKQQ